jgi:hypothetical protein
MVQTKGNSGSHSLHFEEYINNKEWREEGVFAVQIRTYIKSKKQREMK